MGLNLHGFGLSGVQRPSYYESNQVAFNVALERQAAVDKLLADAPRLGFFLRCDPENGAQEQTRTELLAVLDAAVKGMKQ